MKVIGWQWQEVTCDDFLHYRLRVSWTIQFVCS